MRVNAVWHMAAILLLGCVQVAVAGPTEKKQEVIDAEGVSNIEINIDFAAGSLTVRPENQAEAAILDIDYDPDWVDYDAHYRKRGKTGILTLASDLIGRHRHHDDVDNEWHLSLSKKYKTIIDLDLGACDANFDLGGIPLRELHMDVGASSGRIDFSEENPETLEELDIDVGASSLDVLNLGNAHAERIDVSCGAAACDLDFRGDFQGEVTLNLEVGVGSADVIVPDGVAVRAIGDDGWFSSVDFHGMKLHKVEDDIHESENFDSADKRLIIYLQVGLGSIDVYCGR